jgi:hypothetical protein
MRRLDEGNAPNGATPHPALLRNATFPRKGGRGARYAPDSVKPPNV